jgi:hypothetical protein
MAEASKPRKFRCRWSKVCTGHSLKRMLQDAEDRGLYLDKGSPLEKLTIEELRLLLYGY